MSEPTLIPALLRIPTELVKPGRNARTDLGDVTELAMSIAAIGMQEPMTVHDLGDGTFEVHEGHRRLAAAQLARVPHVIAMLRPRFDDADRLQRQLAIHAQRLAFDPMDEAHAFHALMFQHNQTREQVARAAGKTPAYVRDRIALTRLTPDEQAKVRSGRLPIGEALLRVAGRRAEQTGGPRPAPARQTAPRQAPAAYRPPVARRRHFTAAHPLADQAAALCHAAGREHRNRHELIGEVACGEHWEGAIRADLGAVKVSG